MRSPFRRALALLSLLLVAQLAVLRGAMACDAEAMAAAIAAAAVDPHAAHDAHDSHGGHGAHGTPQATHHDGGEPEGGHLPGAGCLAMTMCALVAMPVAAHDPSTGRPDAERLAVGPASPRAWAPRAPEPPPPRG